ncbi:MAG: hypothetical protein NXI04_04630 [Planctomycetaceae bacterium]|nr:hypothetical protein [Planctomycetaceae bacterium]
MQIIFECPVCMKRSSCTPDPAQGPVRCSHCDWSRDEGAGDFDGDYCHRCRVCGCSDLWRQKDFPPGLGLAMVGCGIILSTIAWYNHHPELALGVLMAFALVDMLLYTFMADMLVCYRCRARHRRTALNEQHGAFDLEVSERYIQMKKRQDSAEHASKN